jgi:hypothetical protein
VRRQPKPGEETLTPRFILLGGVPTELMTTKDYQNQIRESFPGERFDKEPTKAGLYDLLTRAGNDILVINGHHAHRDLDDQDSGHGLYPKGNFISINMDDKNPKSPLSILTPDNVKNWRQGASRWPRVVWISSCSVYAKDVNLYPIFNAPLKQQPTIPDAFIPNPNQRGFAFIGQDVPVIGATADQLARDFFSTWGNGIPKVNPNPSLEQVRQAQVAGGYRGAANTIIQGDKNMTYQQFLQLRQTPGKP